MGSFYAHLSECSKTLQRTFEENTFGLYVGETLKLLDQNNESTAYQDFAHQFKLVTENKDKLKPKNKTRF